MQVLSLGPLSIDAQLLLALIAIVCLLFVAGFLEKKAAVKIELRLWLVLVTTLLAGRIVFVLQYWDQYQTNWLSLFNVRDGGFNWLAALITAIAILSYWTLKQQTVRKVVWGSVGVGVGVWLIGFAALTFFKPAQTLSLPIVELRSLHQEPVALSQFKGKPLVLNLWASWCPPCRREMPVLQTAQQQYEQVHFVFANQAESAQIVEQYLQSENIELKNVLLDTQTQIAQLVQSRGLPTTLFIDAQGTVQSYRIGELSEASLRSHLDGLLSDLP